MATSLRHLLLIAKYISAFVFILSFQCHRRLSSQVADWSAAEAYFGSFLMQSSSSTPQFIAYHSYRYHSTDVYEKDVVQGMMLGHKLLAGVSVLLKDPLPEYYNFNGRFCNIPAFSEVIKDINVGATPDNHYSMSILAISTFAWGICVALLLEKRFLQVVPHRRSVTAKGLVPMIKEHRYGVTLVISLDAYHYYLWGICF